MASLEKKTVAELKALAKKKKLSGYSKLKKAELIKLLSGKSPKKSVKKSKCKDDQYLNRASNKCKKVSSFTLADLKKMSEDELIKFRDLVVHVMSFAMEYKLTDNEYLKLSRLQSEALKLLSQPQPPGGGLPSEAAGGGGAYITIGSKRKKLSSFTVDGLRKLSEKDLGRFKGAAVQRQQSNISDAEYGKLEYLTSVIGEWVDARGHFRFDVDQSE